MDKSMTLKTITQRLEDGVSRGDWSALRETDRKLAAVLSRADLAQAEPEALARLREAHVRALTACRDALEAARQRLQALCDHREGRTAYAMNTDDPEWQA
jgi:ABC-type nitrate/sulfonate/bicarbonate transport system substrate-binding protein